MFQDIFTDNDEDEINLKNGELEKHEPKNWEAVKINQKNGDAENNENAKDVEDGKDAKNGEIMTNGVAGKVGQKRVVEEIDCITIDSDDETNTQDQVIIIRQETINF